MAIVLWTLAGSATENDASKIDNLQEGRAPEEESRGQKVASSEGGKKDVPDLEEKVCFTLL